MHLHTLLLCHGRLAVKIGGAQIGANQIVLPRNKDCILQNQRTCFVKQLNPWFEGHEPINLRIMDSLLDPKETFQDK